MRSTALQFDYLFVCHSLSNDANGITELIDREFEMQILSRAIFRMCNLGWILADATAISAIIVC